MLSRSRSGQAVRRDAGGGNEAFLLFPRLSLPGSHSSGGCFLVWSGAVVCGLSTSGGQPGGLAVACFGKGSFFLVTGNRL